jgi:CyaY protein
LGIVFILIDFIISSTDFFSTFRQNFYFNMNESLFMQLSAAIFEEVEHQMDSLNADIFLDGNVLNIELETGEILILNRHTASAEMWLAAKSGGYHFHFHEGDWRDTRDGVSLAERLASVVTLATGCSLSITLSAACYP